MAALADHLWQSTWFVLAVWALTLFVRRDAARVRCYLWLAASIKFLFPSALLSWIGSRFIVQVEDDGALLPIVQQVVSPLGAVDVSAAAVTPGMQQLLTAVWMLGTFVLLGRLIASGMSCRALVRRSVPCQIIASVEVRCSREIAEPGVVGIIDPVILLPERVLTDLSPAQIDAIIAHELCHVRRRDNLIACLHTLVEALFWFHPLVWWIGANLVHEREHACDEDVVEQGNEPQVYAAALVKVCRCSIEAGSVYVSSAGGGDLVARVRGILAGRRSVRRGRARPLAVSAALLACVALPVASGMTVVATSELNLDAGTRAIRVSRAASPMLLVVRDDYVYGRNVSLRELIGQAYSVPAFDVGGNVRGLDFPRYDVELRAPAGLASDPRQLVADLLKDRFNVELVEHPMPRARLEK